MQERIRALEEFTQIATVLAAEMEASQRRMEQRQRRMEERQQQMEEDQQRAEESQRRRDELLQQIFQAVAVMQADIIRIDETHS